MSFDVEWLDLREPADHSARNAEMLASFAALMPEKSKIVDLGSGTGSSVRAISPALPNAEWLLTDNDPLLLAEAHTRHPQVRTEQVDLSRDLKRALSHQSDAITASALIDLVSDQWLDELVGMADGRVLYFALSYDGTEQWFPPHVHDVEIFELFQQHQRGDKGFGPALGSDAVTQLKEKLCAVGYHVTVASSPWQLRAGSLMNALAAGIAAASIEAGVDRKVAETWERSRTDSTHCRIGHLDILAHKNTLRGSLNLT